MYNCEIKTYGFTSEPYALKEIINSIVFNQDVVVYIADLLVDSFPYEEIIQKNKDNLFLIIFSPEGHAYREFRQSIDYLIAHCGVIPKNICIHSTALRDNNNPVSLIGNIAGIAGLTINDIDVDPDHSFNNTSPRHHFICLNRMPRWERAKLIDGIFDRNLDQYGKISYSTIPVRRDYDLVEARMGFKQKYWSRIPMILDQDNMTVDSSFDIDNINIQGALFNVVTESAYESIDPTVDAVAQNSPGITEKTFKAFILGQIPIFIAPMGTVQCTRELGFDVFDDIVDHSYDNIEDPSKRIDEILNQIEYVCNTYSVNDLAKLKEKIHIRFKYNTQTLKMWAFNNAQLIRQWVDYFREQGVV